MVSLPFARIALPIPIPELYDYEIPEELSERAQVGCRVRVPVGHRDRVGYLIERRERPDHPDPKPIREVLDDQPLLGDEILDLLRWTSSYYMASLGDVIEAAVPKRVREARPVDIRWVRLSEAHLPEQKGVGRDTRTSLIDLLRAEGPMPARTLLERTGATPAPLKTLERQGAVEVFRAPAPERESAGTVNPGSLPTLSPHQADAVEAIQSALNAEAYQTFLLHGVTGSGKTEVYLRTIGHALSRGKSALVLLPEIALTPQTVARFRSRFDQVAVLHSMLPDGERLREYERLRSGQARVAIGARSAIFAPAVDLGLIVVDESHEPSYKQESTPRYQARDLAVLRASRSGIPCVLGTATPSLESLHNVSIDRYTELRLPHRVTTHAQATIEVVDRNQDRKSARGSAGLFSTRLIEALEQTLNREEQAVLFLNRRGFARNLHCPSCGHSFHCPDCDIGLTYHRRSDRSLCHYCGRVERIPARCPDCDYPDIQRSRPGTERIEDFLAERFPGVTVGRLDRDTVTSGERLDRILQEFREGRTRILVGTQMVAKGHDLPGVTLVGVLDADVAIEIPDFRAAERTCQLLCQVAGRAGRGERPGRVIIQTRQPDHYAIQAAVTGDLGELYETERDSRQLLGYPPYGHLVRVLCEDEIEDRARESAEDFARVLTTAAKTVPGGDSVQVLGPAPAPLSRLRGRHCFHLLVKARDRSALSAVVRPYAFSKPRWSSSRVVFDVDPQNLT